MSEGYRARVRAQLKLALLSDCGCLKTLVGLEWEGRASGLTWAEIDAAFEGRSFEAQTATILSFACAVKAGSPESMDQARRRALNFGVTEEELAAVAEEAKQILASTAQ